MDLIFEEASHGERNKFSILQRCKEPQISETPKVTTTSISRDATKQKNRTRFETICRVNSIFLQNTIKLKLRLHFQILINFNNTKEKLINYYYVEFNVTY